MVNDQLTKSLIQVIDTSVLFPHRLGAPFKRALRTLTAEILGKIIQNDGMIFNKSSDNN